MCGVTGTSLVFLTFQYFILIIDIFGPLWLFDCCFWILNAANKVMLDGILANQLIFENQNVNVHACDSFIHFTGHEK